LLPKTISWLAAIVATIFLAQTYQRSYRASGNDFSTYLAASRAFWSGESPYDLALPFPYVYPLLLAAVLGPLTLVPYWLAVLVWFLLSVACLAYVVWAVVRVTITTGGGLPPPFAYAAGAGVVALHTGIVQNNLLNGQVNLVLLALLVAAVRTSMRTRIAQPAGAVGSAIAVKLTPLAVLPYFVLRRRWGLVTAALAVALALGTIPALWLGPDGLPHAAGFLGRFAGDAFASATFREHQPLTFSVGGVLAVASGLSPLVASVLGAIGVGVLVLVIEQRGRLAHQGAAAAWTYAAYLVAIPLVSPMSETHHLAFLIPAACLVTCAAISRERPLPLAWCVGLFAACLVTAQLLTSGIVYLAAMLVLLTAVGVGITMPSVRTTQS
jgi:hypothetical protein